MICRTRENKKTQGSGTHKMHKITSDESYLSTLKSQIEAI